MRTVYKYTHPVAERFAITVPFNAKFLIVDRDTRQPDDLAFWFEVETAQTVTVNRSIVIVGTGHPIPEEARQYLGSVKIGYFIWHVYERTM